MWGGGSGGGENRSGGERGKSGGAEDGENEDRTEKCASDDNGDVDRNDSSCVLEEGEGREEVEALCTLLDSTLHLSEQPEEPIAEPASSLLPSGRLQERIAALRR